LSSLTAENRRPFTRFSWGDLYLCFSLRFLSRNLKACFFAGALASVTKLLPEAEMQPPAMPFWCSFFFRDTTDRSESSSTQQQAVAPPITRTKFLSCKATSPHEWSIPVTKSSNRTSDTATQRSSGTVSLATVLVEEPANRCLPS
jgi:hypothetical protein